MASGFGTPGHRVVNPDDIETGEGLAPVVEAVPDTATMDRGSSGWHCEEEEDLCEADPNAHDMEWQLQGQGLEEAGQRAHHAPQAVAEEMTTSVDSGEASSRKVRMKHKLQVLVRVMQEALGIEIKDHVECWLKKE